MNVLLDSCFLSDVRRNLPKALALHRKFRDDGTTVFIPTIAAAEFLTGGTDFEQDSRNLADAGEIVEFSMSDAVAAARIAKILFGRGAFPGWSDVMIAGMAESRGGWEVVTRNTRHFPESKTITY